MSDETFELSAADPFEEQLIEIAKTHRERNAQYRVSPVKILPLEFWLARVTIKGMRAYQATTPAKTKDDILDAAVYSIMILEQLKSEGNP
jgi:hypothetical protein